MSPHSFPGHWLWAPAGRGLSPEASLVIALILLLIAVVLYASARYRTKSDVVRRRIEQALHQQTKLWEATFNCMSEGLSYQDPDFTISGANRAFCELVGQPSLAGKKCYEVVHGTNSPPDTCPMRLSLADGQSHQAEFYEPHLGRYLSVRTDPVKDATGEIVRMVHVVEDVTPRICDRQRIEQLNAELEERVRQRTAELQAANQELEAFAYSVSHDLRAPLRSMDGFSNLLLMKYQDKLDDDGRDFLQRVSHAARQMNQLIDALLHLSQLTRGEMQRAPVDLGVLAQEAIANLRLAAPSREVEVTIADHLVARGDPRLLQIVLQNLLDNAWKFTARCQPARIEVGAKQGEGERIFFVRDNGAGFPMEYAHRLFSPFQRLHTAGEYEGTGIGLATVQRIVRRHGGRVWAEAEPDNGATFYFTLAPRGSDG